jgi:hypothetical protein
METGLLWFIIVGVVGTVALAAVSFTPLRWWWRSAIALVVTTAIAIMLAPGGPLTLGPEASWWNTSPWRELILLALMVVGMIARVVSVAIEKRGSTKAAALSVDRWDFVYPMLFAVPTFSALLSQIQAESLALTHVALAFQTGFFFQTILKKGESR